MVQLGDCITTRIGSSVFIHAPLEQVFSRVAKHDICSDWLEFVSTASYTSERRAGVGTSAHHSGRIMGRTMEWDGMITEWVENGRIVWEATTGTPKKMGMKAMNRVEKEGVGTRYSLEVEYEPPYSILGKIMDLIMIKRSLGKSIQSSNLNLKRISEQT